MADEVTEEMMRVGAEVISETLHEWGNLRRVAREAYLAMRAAAPRSKAEQLGEDIAWLDEHVGRASWNVEFHGGVFSESEGYFATCSGHRQIVPLHPTRAEAIRALRVAVEGGD